jgi:hypothetical protein
MADATETYQRSLPQPAGIRLERYLGIAAAVAGIVGVFAMFGSTETLWYYTRQVFGTLYLLATVVAS